MSKNALVVILFFCFFTKSETKFHVIIDEVNRDHEPYAKLALYMIERYISPKTNTLIIMEKCAHCKPGLQNMHTRLLRHFLKRFTPTMTLQLFFGLPEERLWDYNMFIVDSIDAFRNLSTNIPVTRYEHSFHFFIILTLSTRTELHAFEHMQQIFHECLRFHVDNAVIMFQLPYSKDFAFYTYSPFGEDYCRQVVHTVRYNEYINEHLRHDRLFAAPLRSFHNCTLNVCLHLGYPMLGFRGNRSDPEHMQDINRLEGIEGDVLNALAKTMDFRVKFSIPEGESVIGAHNDSKGCFAEVAAVKADLAIGCFSTSDNLSYLFSYTSPYHHNPIVFIVRSGLHFGPFEQLANAFCIEVWQCLGCCCIVGIIFIRSIVSYTSRQLSQKIVGEPSSSNFTKLIVIMMGNPIQALPRHSCARLLLLSWIVATFFLRNAYQANMFDTLRISRRIPIPPSLPGLIDKPYTLLSHRYVEFYPQNMTLIVLNISQRYRMVQNSETPLMATYSLLATLAWHNRQNWETSRLTYVAEPIYQMQISMVLKKHSKLRSIFNYRLKQLMTAGITAHIGEKHVKRQFETMNARSQLLPEISMNMLKGLYMLYGMLMGMAFVLFILELLAVKILFFKKLMDWMHNFM